MLFTGGPCTVGPGAIVQEQLKHVMRSHDNIIGDDAPFMKKAIEFYKKLANTAATNSHCIDIFACCLDQTGLLEMKDCFRQTGYYFI